MEASVRPTERSPYFSSTLQGIPDFRGRERFQSEDPGSDLAQQGTLGEGADPGGQQVIRLGEDERGEQIRRTGGFHPLHHSLVESLALVDPGQQPTRIEQDQRVPKSWRSSSTRSARVGSPLRKRGIVGSGWKEEPTRRRTPSRMSSSSLRPSSWAARSSSLSRSSGMRTVVVLTSHILPEKGDPENLDLDLERPATPPSPCENRPADTPTGACG